MSDFLPLQNAQAVPVAGVPRMSIDDLRASVVDAVAAGARLSAFFGHPVGDGRLTLLAVLADDQAGSLYAGSAEVGDVYPSLTPDCPQAHWFEREVAEQWGVSPNFVRREIWRGAIKSTRFGRTVRVPVAEVERYSEERTHKTA